MKRSVLNVLAVAALFVSTSAFAGTATSAANPDNIKATVTANCTVATFNLTFGNYDPFSTSDVTQNTTISVSCTKGTAATVDLDNGVNGARQMLDAVSGDLLSYGIYTDNAFASSWTAGVSMGTSASKNTPLTKTGYGRIVKNQDVTPGSYTDTMTATVNF